MFKGSFVSKHAANSAEVVSLRAESKKLYEHYRLQFEIQCSDHKADEHPDLGQDTGFQEYSALIMVKRHFAVLNDAYVGMFGGFGYISNFPKFENRDWADRDLESNIGHSHITGNIGMAIGKDWHVYKSWDIRTEIRAIHLSDPLSTDRGKNLMGGSIGLTYHL